MKIKPVDARERLQNRLKFMTLEAYRAYFQTLIDELRTKHKFTGAKVGQPQNWYSFASGVGGLIFSNSFAQGGKVRAELYIDLQDKDQNKRVFDRLQEQQETIEKEYGSALTLQRKLISA